MGFEVDMYQLLLTAICMIAVPVLLFWIITFGRQIYVNKRKESRSVKSATQSEPKRKRDTDKIDHLERKKTIVSDPNATEIERARIALENYKHQKIKLAVIGRSNMGKSTFINLIRDIKETGVDYAETGFGDTTMAIAEYKHPKNENISLWDLPGLGTVIMPKDKFMKEVKLEMFDFCFIFIDSVLMEDDVWLVQQLKKRGIPFCFVRSKLDIDITNAKREGITEACVIRKIKTQISTSMSKNDITKDSKLFLVSNVKEHFHVGELNSLFQYLVDKFDQCKIETLLFFLPVLSPDIIQLKFELMQKRISTVACVAGLIAAVPIPIIDIAVNEEIMKAEVSRYRQVFGLDTDYVKKVPRLTHSLSSKEKFIGGLNSSFQKFATYGATMLSQADLFVPVLGSAVAATSTFAFVHWYLRKHLSEVREDGLRVYEFYIQNKV